MLILLLVFASNGLIQDMAVENKDRDLRSIDLNIFILFGAILHGYKQFLLCGYNFFIMKVKS